MSLAGFAELKAVTEVDEVLLPYRFKDGLTTVPLGAGLVEAAVEAYFDDGTARGTHRGAVDAIEFEWFSAGKTNPRDHVATIP